MVTSHELELGNSAGVVKDIPPPFCPPGFTNIKSNLQSAPCYLPSLILNQHHSSIAHN